MRERNVRQNGQMRKHGRDTPRGGRRQLRRVRSCVCQRRPSRRRSHVRGLRGKRRYRGKTCARDKISLYARRKIRLLPARLRDRVYICGITGCWLWSGKRNSGNGYSKVRHDGRIWMVHRLVYTLLVGLIPKGLLLDHKCRRRACCNPKHLEPVTSAENTRRGEAVMFRSKRG